MRAPCGTITIYDSAACLEATCERVAEPGVTVRVMPPVRDSVTEQPPVCDVDVPADNMYEFHHSAAFLTRFMKRACCLSDSPG